MIWVISQSVMGVRNFTSEENQQLNHSDEFSLVTLAVEVHTSRWSIEECCLAQKAIIISYKTKQQMKLLLKENDLMLRMVEWICLG